ncbi:MAG: DNA-binding response regulator [Dethiobacter sp.]|jgi:two-component system response regulator NreC|nr:MAG: DNA-binding response regulator [Dethiobacter sp.]
MRKIKILVVDDHTIVREGICTLLGLSPEMEVVGETSNGMEALDMVRTFVPDVVLLDISMPIMDGLEATHRICREFPGVKILVLTQYGDREYVFPIIEAGARGFINKTAASSELVSGIRSLYRGDSFLSPSVARFLVEDYQLEASFRKNQDPYEQLTDREKEIFKLLAEGYNTKEIAEMLVISPKTVDGHKTRLMAKLDLHSRVEVVKYALRKGIIRV